MYPLLRHIHPPNVLFLPIKNSDIHHALSKPPPRGSVDEASADWPCLTQTYVQMRTVGKGRGRKEKDIVKYAIERLPDLIRSTAAIQGFKTQESKYTHPLVLLG